MHLPDHTKFACCNLMWSGPALPQKPHDHGHDHDDHDHSSHDHSSGGDQTSVDCYSSILSVGDASTKYSNECTRVSQDDFCDKTTTCGGYIDTMVKFADGPCVNSAALSKTLLDATVVLKNEKNTV